MRLKPMAPTKRTIAVVMAIAESPKEKGLIWAGTNDGLLQVTRDNGKTWTNVTKNMPGLPPWGSVRSIAPSRYDAGTAYVTVDFHQMNNRDPFVYRTTDYGQTFKLMAAIQFNAPWQRSGRDGFKPAL